VAYRLQGVVNTNLGRVRTNNEDNYYLFGQYKEDTNISITKCELESTADNEVAAVFDGMGGEEAGEVASLMAASGLAAITEGNWQEQIRNQLIRLNNGICNEMMRRGGGRMGTTFAGVYFKEDKAVCVNVGDSRVYLLRDGYVYLMSHDHSEAQNMIDQNLMTEDEARASGKWHVLSQCLGVFPDEFVIVPFFSDVIDIKTGDRFMMCSDGLTDVVLDDDIAYVMSKGTAGEVSEALVNNALNNGGFDNVTVMVVDVI